MCWTVCWQHLFSLMACTAEIKISQNKTRKQTPGKRPAIVDGRPTGRAGILCNLSANLFVHCYFPLLYVVRLEKNLNSACLLVFQQLESCRGASTRDQSQPTLWSSCHEVPHLPKTARAGQGGLSSLATLAGLSSVRTFHFPSRCLRGGCRGGPPSCGTTPVPGGDRVWRTAGSAPLRQAAARRQRARGVGSGGASQPQPRWEETGRGQHRALCHQYLCQRQDFPPPAHPGPQDERVRETNRKWQKLIWASFCNVTYGLERCTELTAMLKLCQELRICLIQR